MLAKRTKEKNVISFDIFYQNIQLVPFFRRKAATVFLLCLVLSRFLCRAYTVFTPKEAKVQSEAMETRHWKWSTDLCFP